MSAHIHIPHVEIRATIGGQSRGGSIAILCRCGAVKAPHRPSGWGPRPTGATLRDYPWPERAAYEVLQVFAGPESIGDVGSESA